MALIQCSECGKDVSDKAAACPHCGAPINMVEAQPVPPQSAPVSTAQMSPIVIIGLAGAVIMGMGVFLPFFKAPLFGSINLFKNGSGDGYYILLMALLAALLILIRKWAFALIPAVLGGAILLYDVISFNSKLSQVQIELSRNLADNPSRGIFTGMMNSVSLDIGTFVIGLGVILCIAASLWGLNQEKTAGDNQ